MTTPLEAVRELIRYAGDDPDREGLLDTPARVLKAWKEFFRGYKEDPIEHLNKVFSEAGNYDEIVLVRDIDFLSHCEHHMVPIVGKVHVAYLPNPSKGVVGLSKLARVVDGYSRRLQVQERLTKQIAGAIHTKLEARATAVVIDAVHHCMTIRGVNKQNSVTTTSAMLGAFRDSAASRQEVLSLIRSGR